jgi:hypothetical protein
MTREEMRFRVRIFDGSKYFTIYRLPKIFTGIRNYCCRKFDSAKLKEKVKTKFLSDAILIIHFSIAFPYISK